MRRDRLVQHATVVITIAATNDPPVAREDRATAEAGATVTIDVVGNDFDIDGDELRLVEVYRTDHGAVRIVDGVVEFVADEGSEGTARIDYAVTDGDGARAIGTAIVEVTAAREEIPTPTTTAPAPTTTTTPVATTTRPLRSTTTTTTTTSAPVVDDPPIGADDSATVSEDGSIWIDVLANDTDPEGSPLGLTGVGTPLHGTAVTAFGQVRYTPTPDYAGDDAFTYTLSDGTNPGVTATVRVTITPENDVPVATAPDVTVAEDTALGGAVLRVTATDADPGDTLVYAIASGNPGPKFAIDGNGDVTVIAALDHESTAAYTLGLTVSDGTVVVPLTVTVTVGDVDERPVVTDDAATTSEDVPAALDISVGDSDPEGATLTFVVPATTTAAGTLAETGGIVTYTPPADWSGTDTFTYTAADPGGNVSTAATVTLTVIPVNDAPVAADDGGLGFTITEGTLLVTADVTANDTDVDDPIDSSSVAVATAPATGTLVNNGDGTFDFDPAPGWSGTETFTYTITDSGGLTSDIATVSITVTRVVVADAGGPYAIAEGDTLVLDGSGSTGSPTSWNWDLDNDGQYDDASGANPSVPWATLATLGVDDDGAYPVALEVDGGGDTATTTLTIDNTAPVLTTSGAASVSAGSPYTLDLASLDPGADTIGSWTINWGDGTIEVVPGDPSSVTHTYARGGFTFDILTSASDEDGTYLQNELLVPSFNGDTVFRFEATTGAFLQTFATADGPIETHVGPDGRLYVSGENSHDVLRYDAETGAFVDDFVGAGSNGLSGAEGLASGRDGHLYVADYTGNRVLRFDGTTGAFIDVFASAGLTRPYDLVFGPDSNLYVGNYTTHEVVRFDGATGAFIDVFVTAGDGGLDTPEQMTFGPDGNLYVASFQTDEVLRYNGTTGAFIDVFVAAGGVGDLDKPTGLAFGPDGNLYVGDHTDDAILRFDGTTGTFLDEYVAPGSGGLSQPDPMTFLAKTRVSVTGDNEDFDAVADGVDNCPTVFNPDQFDTDRDGTGDACDESPTAASSGIFTASGQSLGAAKSRFVALGDLDGDGDLDATFANEGSPNSVWFNDGSGNFTDSGQAIGSGSSVGAAIADLDGDGDLDIVYAQTGGIPNTLWFNDGSGTFTDSLQSLGSTASEHVVVGDVDGDGDLDLAFANRNLDANTIWLNDGSGTFTDSLQALDAGPTEGVAFGDLDGDGDLDLGYANRGTADTIWLNDGTGVFIDSGQTLDTGTNQAVEFSDIDADGDLDAVFVGDDDQTQIWRNDGSGSFTATASPIAIHHDLDMALGDLDGDGDLDIFAGSHTEPNRVHLNDGGGAFTDSGQLLGNSGTEAVALGDLDGDGDLDAIAANAAGGGEPNTVWFNEDNWALSSLAGDLVITEVLYNGTVIPTEEFVEIHNSGASPIDLTGFRLADHDVKSVGAEDVDYTFPALDMWGSASTLLPGDHAVVWLSYDGVTLPPVNNPASGLEYVVAGGTAKLDNLGDEVWLVDPADDLVDYMAYLFAGSVTSPPVQLGIWDYSVQLTLWTLAGESLQLTPHGIDTNSSTCWERTASGDADGRCVGALPTFDSDGKAALKSSVGADNNTP